jgi:hypothetical protein
MAHYHPFWWAGRDVTITVEQIIERVRLLLDLNLDLAI